MTGRRLACVALLVCIGTCACKQIIECPKSCPANVYKPICSRGKSYANLCVLKQEICKKNIPTEVYQDIEACPGFNKLEDETGASVEAIDKNGVIFRGFFDESTKDEKVSDQSPHFSPKQKPSTRSKCSSYRARYRRLKAILCSRQCPPEGSGSPVCILGIRYPSSCAVKQLVCATRLPLSAIFLMEPCRPVYNDDSDDESDLDGPLEHWMNQFDVSMLRQRADEENATARAVSRDTSRHENRDEGCKQNCDPNEYDPVCIKERAFSNACYLKNAICDGQVDADLLKFVTKCQIFGNNNRTNQYDVNRVNA